MLVSAPLPLATAQAFQIQSQRLVRTSPTGTLPATLAALGGIQIDTISTLARSHELVAFARVAGLTSNAIHDVYWGGHHQFFEYWYHAACILPIEMWPVMAGVRARREKRGRRWHHLDDAPGTLGIILGRLEREGPLTARQLGGAKQGGAWWDWSQTKIAAEWLLDTGHIVCTTRRGFARLYDLPERVIPPALRAVSMSADECRDTLIKGALNALGVATAHDVATYIGYPVAEVSSHLKAHSPSLTVEGWRDTAYVADPDTIPQRPGRGAARPRFLSPFDSLVWDRVRLERLFGVHYRLEAYVPAALRVRGYYAMPILAGNTILGTVDPKREPETLVARILHIDATPTPTVCRSVAEALSTAAQWVGLSHVRIDMCSPDSARAEVEAHLAQLAN